MVHESMKILRLVISAIKNISELKGFTSREILHYISSIYNIPTAIARYQIQNTLKRGVAYGILKKSDGHYNLPTDSEIARQEVAIQEIGLLDQYLQRKTHRSRDRGARRSTGARYSQRIVNGRKRKSTRRKSREYGLNRVRTEAGEKNASAEFLECTHDEGVQNRT